MSTPYIGEIRLVGFTFAPPGWLACDGSLLSISAYDTLFNLLGTTYGGDGQSTFALPDLRGRVPVHQGQGPGLQSYTLGQVGGQASVTLTANQIGLHSHPLMIQNGPGNVASPVGSYFAALPSGASFKPFLPTPPAGSYQPMVSKILPAGNSQPHDNMHPYQAALYVIATQGIYPSQS